MKDKETYNLPNMDLTGLYTKALCDKLTISLKSEIDLYVKIIRDNINKITAVNSGNSEQTNALYMSFFTAYKLSEINYPDIDDQIEFDIKFPSTPEGLMLAQMISKLTDNLLRAIVSNS